MSGWIIGLLWLAGALGSAVAAMAARDVAFGPVRLRLVLSAATLVFLGGATVAGLLAPAGNRTVELASGALVALVASIGGAPVVAESLELSRLLRVPLDEADESDDAARRREVHARLAQPVARAAQLPASAVIGVVERLAFIVALLLSLPEVAAIVFVVKALGQYSTGATKQIAATRVLGTLASVAWALLAYLAFLAMAR